MLNLLGAFLLLLLAGNSAAQLPFSQLEAARHEAEEIHCLALNLYFEARSEDASGKYAVGHVVLNRVDSPLYPDTVCSVVWEKRYSRRAGWVAMFSWTLDGKSDRPQEAVAWNEAVRIANALWNVDRPYGLRGPVGLSTHYHADYVAPRWAAQLTKVAEVGQHIFYH